MKNGEQTPFISIHENLNHIKLICLLHMYASNKKLTAFVLIKMSLYSHCSLIVHSGLSTAFEFGSYILLHLTYYFKILENE